MATVPLSRLLWSSRGKHWGFRFLLHPSDVKDSGFWLGVHDRTFGASSDVPLYLQGQIELPDGSSVPFQAARFYDQGHEWRDDSGGRGREIPHELLILHAPDQRSELSASNWPQAIMDVLRPTYSELYPLQKPDGVLGEKQLTLANQLVTVASPLPFQSQHTTLDISVPVDSQQQASHLPENQKTVGWIAGLLALVVLFGIVATALMLVPKAQALLGPPR